MQNTTTPQKKYPTIENIALPPPLLPPPCGLSRPIHQRTPHFSSGGRGWRVRAASTNGTTFQKHALLRPQKLAAQSSPGLSNVLLSSNHPHCFLYSMSDKTHTRQYFPPPLKRCFRPGKPGKCVCVWLEKLGDANGKCTTPPPEPPRFYFFRSSLCFFPMHMHMHTMHCIYI